MAIAVGLLALTTCAACAGGSSAQRRPSAPLSRVAPFFGLDVPGADPVEVDRVASVLGCRPSVTSVFVKVDTQFSVTSLRRLSALAGGAAVPQVTLEPWPQALRSGQVDQPGYTLASVASGQHDAALARIARVLAAYGKPVYLRYAHEMNGDWYPWAARVNGGSPAEYVTAWRHVHDLFAREGATAVRWIWSPAALPSGPKGRGGGLAALYPGDAYVDFVGLTGYGTGGSADATFGSWLEAIREFTDRPAVLAEIGADGPRKADWITSLGDYLARTPSVVGFVWFNTTPATTGASGHYRVDDSPDHVAAFRAVLARLSVPCAAPST